MRHTGCVLGSTSRRGTTRTWPKVGKGVRRAGGSKSGRGTTRRRIEVGKGYGAGCRSSWPGRSSWTGGGDGRDLATGYVGPAGAATSNHRGGCRGKPHPGHPALNLALHADAG